MSVLAERVKKLRKASKQSQNEVGKALGKSRETVSKYELGEREPDPEAIVSLSKHFNVSTDYILGTTDDSGSTSPSKRKPFSPELSAFKKYLEDEQFIPYMQLAVRMKDSHIDIQQFKTLIDKFLKQEKQ